MTSPRPMPLALMLLALATTACGSPSTDVAGDHGAAQASATVAAPSSERSMSSALGEDAGSASLTDLTDSCPTTAPGDGGFTPASEAPDGPPSVYGVVWYGTPHLWTMLNPEGEVWRDLPVGADGSLAEKTFWWSENYSREDPGEITVTAGHLNGSTPAFGVSKRAGSGFNPFMLASTHESVTVVGVDLPEPGCWELTAEYQEASLGYVVWVAP